MSLSSFFSTSTVRSGVADKKLMLPPVVGRSNSIVASVRSYDSLMVVLAFSPSPIALTSFELHDFILESWNVRCGPLQRKGVMEDLANAPYPCIQLYPSQEGVMNRCAKSKERKRARLP